MKVVAAAVVDGGALERFLDYEYSQCESHDAARAETRAILWTGEIQRETVESEEVVEWL
jgi:hypothetical protein